MKKELLDYQVKTDELRALEAEVKKGTAGQEYSKQKRLMKSAEEAVCRADTDAKELLAKIEVFRSQKDLIMKELAELEVGVSETDDRRSAEFLERKSYELSKEIEKLLQEINKVKEQITLCKKEYDEAFAQGKAANLAAKKAKASLEDEVKARKPIADKLKKEIAELESGFDPKINEILTEHRDSKTANIIVPAIDGTMCGGCYISLEQSTKDKLESAGLAVCPNCRRILYKE